MQVFIITAAFVMSKDINCNVFIFSSVYVNGAGFCEQSLLVRDIGAWCMMSSKNIVCTFLSSFCVTLYYSTEVDIGAMFCHLILL